MNLIDILYMYISDNIIRLTGKYETQKTLVLTNTCIALIRETGAYMSNLVPPKRKLSKFHNAADVKVDKIKYMYIAFPTSKLGL